MFYLQPFTKSLVSLLSRQIHGNLLTLQYESNGQNP